MIALVMLMVTIYLLYWLIKTVHRNHVEKKTLLMMLKDDKYSYEETYEYMRNMKSEKGLGMYQRQRYNGMLEQKAHSEMLTK